MQEIFLLSVILSFAPVILGTAIKLPPIVGVVQCDIGISSYVGLLPFPPESHNGSMEGEACNYVVHCKPDPGEETTTAVTHYCPYANSSRPYFDVNTCECVESSDNCELNNDNKNKLNCVTKYTDQDNEESCQNFGPQNSTKVYYINHFPNLNDPKSFWQCHPFNTTSTIAASFNCSDNNDDNIIWDQESCQCENIKDANVRSEKIKFNSHPSNRFNCATRYHDIDCEDACKDDLGQYYTGKVANRGFDQNIFFDCVKDDIIFGKSNPRENSCGSNELFDILQCECTGEAGFDPAENFNPGNYKKCSIPIITEDEETCKDEQGVYHIGQIPHKKDCAKYWNCGENRIPAVQTCPEGLLFSVMTEFCGCDYEEMIPCADNLKPENRFRCANNTKTSRGLTWNYLY